MATKKLSEVTKVTTMNTDDYAVMNTADGKIVQIKKTDLANALADVMRTATIGEKGLMDKDSFMSRGSVFDANAAIKNGLYSASNTSLNLPVNDYCLIIVYSKAPYILQELLALNGGKRYYRKSIDNAGTWGGWFIYQ